MGFYTCKIEKNKPSPLPDFAAAAHYLVQQKNFCQGWVSNNTVICTSHLQATSNISI